MSESYVKYVYIPIYTYVYLCYTYIYIYYMYILTDIALQEGLMARRLLAAAAAQLAVQRPGKALVQLHPDAVFLGAKQNRNPLGNEGRP